MKFYRAQDDITVGSANLSFYLFYFVNSPIMEQILSRIKAEISGMATLGISGVYRPGSRMIGSRRKPWCFPHL
jgi:hypothetical protein